MLYGAPAEVINVHAINYKVVSPMSINGHERVAPLLIIPFPNYNDDLHDQLLSYSTISLYGGRPILLYFNNKYLL